MVEDTTFQTNESRPSILAVKLKDRINIMNIKYEDFLIDGKVYTKDVSIALGKKRALIDSLAIKIVSLFCVSFKLKDWTGKRIVDGKEGCAEMVITEDIFYIILNALPAYEKHVEERRLEFYKKLKEEHPDIFE